MVDQIFFPNPVKPVKVDQARATRKSGADQVSGPSFATVLDSKLPAQGVKFSQHALDRLKARNITFSDSDLANLEGAVNSVANKGGKESLVMMGDAALVVSVKNRTVVTAMDRSQMKGNVFTNIDSAIII